MGKQAIIESDNAMHEIAQQAIERIYAGDVTIIGVSCALPTKDGILALTIVARVDKSLPRRVGEAGIDDPEMLREL